MQRKLIAIDLDGTTLNDKSQISARTKNVLQKAQDAGHVVSIVTGRPYRISGNFYEELGLKTPMINFNGALGHMPNQEWDKEYGYTVRKDITFDLMENHADLGIENVVAEDKLHSWVNQTNHKVPESLSAFFPQATPLNRQSMQVNPNSMILFLNAHQNRDAVKARLLERYGSEVTVNVWGGPDPILEVSPRGVEKAVGVDFLSYLYGIRRSDILAFGDEANDYTILSYAGWGVAMKNGTEIAQSLAKDITTKTNDEDGMADYIEKYLSL